MKLTKFRLFVLLAVIIGFMTTLQFEVVTPGRGVIVGGSGDIDVVTPDSGFINVVNVSAGDFLEKGEVIFSYNNLEIFYRNKSLTNIIEFLRKKKEVLQQDVSNLNTIFSLSQKNLTQHNQLDHVTIGSNSVRFLQELNSLARKVSELQQTESLNQAEYNELERQKELLERKLVLLKKSGSPQIELIESEREVAQLSTSTIKLNSELLALQVEMRNEISNFQVTLLEKISLLTEEIDRIEKELIESVDAQSLTLGKQEANVITSPVSGTVLSIEKQFTVGSYIEASQKVLTIKQAQSNSLIEAKIEAKYRPFVVKGALAKIVINSPGYKKNLTGVVESISVDSFLDENNPQSNVRFYEIEILPTDASQFQNDMIGVQVDTFIVSNNVTVFEYITATIAENVYFNVW